MGIESLNEQQKSVLLAKVMNWVQQVKSYGDESVVAIGGQTVATVDTDLIPDEGLPELYFMPNLYDPANMALAWECHLWMLKREIDALNPFKTQKQPYMKWCKDGFPWIFKTAQQIWLDRVLELAIAAGLVELEEERG